jgi:type IV secretory pathway VirB6-like protein
LMAMSMVVCGFEGWVGVCVSSSRQYIVVTWFHTLIYHTIISHW